MALDNLPAFPDDMYDTAHDGAVPQPVTPRKPISPFSFTKHLTRTPVPVAVVPEDLPDADLPLFTPQSPVGVVTAQALVDTCRSYLSHADVEKSAKPTATPTTLIWDNSANPESPISRTRLPWLPFWRLGAWMPKRLKRA